jgi:integrase
MHTLSTTISKWVTEAGRDAGIPDGLVLYSARHTFGTEFMAGEQHLKKR